MLDHKEIPMNKFWTQFFFITVIVTYCGSAHAGWFDGQKKQKASVQVPPAEVSLPVKTMTPVPKEKMNTISQGQLGSLDAGASGFKLDQKAALENSEKDRASVRLSIEETKKMKEELLKLQQGMKVVRDAKQVASALKTEVKPASVPFAPKRPVLPKVQRMVPVAPAKPQSFKTINVTEVSNSKK